MSSSDILESFNDEGDSSYLEEMVQQCCRPLPNPFFTSADFVSQYLFLCDEMCTFYLCRSQSGHILASEPRLLRLQSPAYVFGDVHGNMQDLLAFGSTMWPLGMHLTPGTFLFLGDYVDRGLYGIEILTYIFAQKVMLPEKVFLLRGNHEVKAVNVASIVYLHRRVATVTTGTAASSAS
jgi:serine/threonine-protein phosphatase